MFFHRKPQQPTPPTGGFTPPPIDEAFMRKFRERYDPYNLKDFPISPRAMTEIPNFDAVRPGMREKAHALDLERQTDRMAGAKAAVAEIAKLFLSESGTSPTAAWMLAALAARCGYECSAGTLTTLYGFTKEQGDQSRIGQVPALAKRIGLMIPKGDDGLYVFGQHIYEEMSLCGYLVFQSHYQEVLKPVLQAQLKISTDRLGESGYWELPPTLPIRESPKELAAWFGTRLDFIFSVYCRFPQERMLAIAFTAQAVLHSMIAQNVMSITSAAALFAAYLARTARYAPFALLVKVESAPKASFSAGGADLPHTFTQRYAPYSLPDYRIEPRKPEELPTLEPDAPPVRYRMMEQVEEKRAEDPMLGARMAAEEIYQNLLRWLRDDRGVRAENLLAACGAIGGRLCVQGLLETLEGMIAQNAQNRAQLKNAVAGMLQIALVETKDGKQYVMGDRLADACFLFYQNALGRGITDAETQTLRGIIVQTTECAGKENYWETPVSNEVGAAPDWIADLLTPRIEPSLKAFCRFPQERMMAMAFATQKAMKSLRENAVISEEKAFAILAEYSWRTAHCPPQS